MAALVPLRALPIAACVIVLAGFATVLQAQPLAAPASGADELTLSQFLQRVVSYNESIQSRLLAFQAARSQRSAENGAFEPAVFANADYVDRSKPNTIEEERTLRSGGIFSERNQTYSSGVEVVSPIGTKVRVGATGSELINNIQKTVVATLDAEYETQVGLTVEQPLLKGAGLAANLAPLLLAARTSEVAFQEYRRQLMQVMADAEVTYWQLYYSQQELRLASDSVGVAQTLVSDTRAALDAGRGSSLDVLEAEAGLAVRRTRESQARQKRTESANRMAAYFGGVPRAASLVATEAPTPRPVDVSAADGMDTALAMSPDKLRADAQVAQEQVRVRYARNQKLPQVDLKASYGLHGLGTTWRHSLADVEDRSFDDWEVSLEMRIPILGGVRGRNEYRAANQRLLQAERSASDLTTQLRTTVDTARDRVTQSYTAAQESRAVVEFRSNLLDARMQGRSVGRIDSRAVLEAEQDLFGARLDQLQSEIEYQRSLLDLQVVSGTLLQARGLESSFAELESGTKAWAARAEGPLPLDQYKEAVLDRWPTAPAIPFKGDPATGQWKLPLQWLRLRK